MKKLISQGLLAVALLSLSIPIAHADVTTTTNSSDMSTPAGSTTHETITTPSGTTSQSGTTTSTGQTTSTTSISQMSTVPSGPPVLTAGEVVLGPFNSTYGSPLPQLSIYPGANMRLTLMNPSPTPMTFSAPDIGQNITVPANSEKVVYIDASQTASLTPGQQVAYYVTDANGNRLASSTFTNEALATSMITTSTLDQELAAKYPPKSEPVAARPTPQRSSTVRGYW